MSDNPKPPAKTPSHNLPGKLDPTSNQFDPLAALYAPPVSQPSKNVVVYDNIAHFDAALAKSGIFAIGTTRPASTKTATKTSKQQPPSTSSAATATTGSEQSTEKEEKKYLDIPGRRFLLHQAPIQTTGIKKRHKRSLFSKMDEMPGPLAGLTKFMESRCPVKVYTRKQKGIRGITTGIIKLFDKQWNIVLENACEVWKRRKYRFSENPTGAAPQAKDCSERLKQLGIRLPQIKVRNLNRKYVECTRKSRQLMIRGEQIVLIAPAAATAAVEASKRVE